MSWELKISGEGQLLMLNNMVIKFFQNSKILHFIGLKSEFYLCSRLNTFNYIFIHLVFELHGLLKSVLQIIFIYSNRTGIHGPKWNERGLLLSLFFNAVGKIQAPDSNDSRIRPVEYDAKNFWSLDVRIGPKIIVSNFRFF